MSIVLQELLETKLSKKEISKKILESIDTGSELFMEMVEKVNKLRSGNYYKSKNQRYMDLGMSSEDIVLYLISFVLPIEVVSPLQSICTQLGNKLGYANKLDGVKTAAEVIAVCSGELYELYHSEDYENDTGTLGIKPLYELSHELKTLVRRGMYLPPMICRPVPWIDNTDGGNVTGSGSVILGKMNQHEEEQCLDVINTLQDIPWSLNERMLELDETPNKELETIQQKQQFNYMRDISREVYRGLLNSGNKFYFVWKYDFRGRMYSQTYHCSPQGTEYKKSILDFHKKELLTEEIIL